MVLLSTVSSYEMITVPMFLPMAELVLISGIADDLSKAGMTVFSHVALTPAQRPVEAGVARASSRHTFNSFRSKSRRHITQLGANRA